MLLCYRGEGGGGLNRHHIKFHFIKFVAIKIADFLKRRLQFEDLSSLSTDATRQLDVLWHDGHTFGMDSAQVGVLEEANQVSFRCLLKSLDSWSLESQVSLEVLGDLTDKTLEWQLSDQKLSRFLVSPDLSECDSTRSVSVWFLHSSSGWGALASSLGSQLLSWGFASSRFACGLLSTGHFDRW